MPKSGRIVYFDKILAWNGYLLIILLCFITSDVVSTYSFLVTMAGETNESSGEWRTANEESLKKANLSFV